MSVMKHGCLLKLTSKASLELSLLHCAKLQSANSAVYCYLSAVNVPVLNNPVTEPFAVTVRLVPVSALTAPSSPVARQIMVCIRKQSLSHRYPRLILPRHLCMLAMGCIDNPRQGCPQLHPVKLVTIFSSQSQTLWLDIDDVEFPLTSCVKFRLVTGASLG